MHLASIVFPNCHASQNVAICYEHFVSEQDLKLKKPKESHPCQKHNRLCSCRSSNEAFGKSKTTNPLLQSLTTV